MAIAGYCPICSKGMTVVAQNPYKFNGSELQICDKCFEQIETLSSEDVSQQKNAKVYFQGLIDKNRPEGLGLLLAKRLVEGPIPEKEADAPEDDQMTNTVGTSIPSQEFQDPLETSDSSPESSSASSSSPAASLIVTGVIWAIIAIILYVVSIQEVQGLKVANMQATVFAAASAVISAISFIGARIVSALYNR